MLRILTAEGMVAMTRLLNFQTVIRPELEVHGKNRKCWDYSLSQVRTDEGVGT